MFWTKYTRSSPPRTRRARSASSPIASRSSDSISARPSSMSRRPPASTLARIWSRLVSSAIAIGFLACPIDDGVGQCFELVAMRVRDEERARAGRVVECGIARAGQRVGRADTDQRSLERAAGEGCADDLVLLRREEQRHRGRPLAEVGAGDLPCLLRETRAVEDVVGDLEGDSEREAERAELGVAAGAEQARGLEELPGLEGAPLEIGVDRGLGVARLAALHRLAARQREARVRERADGGGVARLGE